MMAALLPQSFEASHSLQLTPGPTAGGFWWSALCVYKKMRPNVLALAVSSVQINYGDVSIVVVKITRFDPSSPIVSEYKLHGT